VLWLTPRSWLVHCPALEEEALAEEIARSFPQKSVHAALYGDALSWFELSGARAAAVLADGAFVSLDRGGLRPGCVKRTLFAGVSVVIVREAENAWLLGVEASRARYLATWFEAAACRDRALLET
jgi:heterotetrameric sarcosine oxidase gamma subunit